VAALGIKTWRGINRLTMFAAVFLLASAATMDDPVPLAQLTRQECPAPTFDKEQGYIGDRAIISADGTKIVVQCGDGVVRAWQSGTTTFKPIGVMPLFRAARQQGIVASDVRCPWSSLIRDNIKIEADCDVLDHDNGKNVYVLRTPASPDSFVVAGQNVLRESTVWQRFGALLPGKRAGLVIVDRQTRPELLQTLSIKDGRVTVIARLPSPNLLFEDGEGSADGVAYSATYKSVIVSFGGAFRVADEMTYVRAFSEDGKERWKIGGKLPPRNDGLIVGDFTKLIVFATGRYALLAKSSDRSASQIINLGDGKVVSAIRGWPLAAARDSAVGFVKDESGTLSLINLDAPPHGGD
jgi:hypothetical protein